MRCERVRALLDAWQDRELGALAAWRVARHVTRCAVCGAEAAVRQELSERLGAANPLPRVPVAVGAPRGYRGFGYALAAGVAALAAALPLLRHGATPEAGGVQVAVAVRRHGASPSPAPASTPAPATTQAAPASDDTPPAPRLRRPGRRRAAPRTYLARTPAALPTGAPALAEERRPIEEPVRLSARLATAEGPGAEEFLASCLAPDLPRRRLVPVVVADQRTRSLVPLVVEVFE